jgi:hypothetical protein
VTHSFKPAIRACLLQPYPWVLLGTILPPLNLMCAASFWLVAKLRHHERASENARCLNVQITYTLALTAPFLIGSTLTPRLPPGSPEALFAGGALGLVGAVSILLLIFLNAHALAKSLRAQTPTIAPRIRFVGETGSQGQGL